MACAMTNAAPPLRDRIGAAVLTVAVVAVLGYLLVRGLAFRHAAGPVRQTSVFALTPDPPPPPVRAIPPPRRVDRPSGRAAPPNLRARATAITAPVPVILLAPPPPITLAPLPDLGAQASSGAADRAGPGTGAGGTGDGHGAGGAGDGDGGGRERVPRLIRGRIKRSDIPEPVLDSGFHGSVDVRFAVETDGRATGCTVMRSSGNASIDQATCQAIEARFRYAPWRDADGRPVRSTVLREQFWDIDPPSPG